MKHFLYRLSSGIPAVLDYKIPGGALDGAVLVQELDEPVDVSGKEFDGSMRLVDKVLPYDEMRRREYPKIADQLDALWHAMDDFAIPRAEPFYSSILAVKQKYPKK